MQISNSNFNFKYESASSSYQSLTMPRYQLQIQLQLQRAAGLSPDSVWLGSFGIVTFAKPKQIAKIYANRNTQNTYANMRQYSMSEKKREGGRERGRRRYRRSWSSSSCGILGLRLAVHLIFALDDEATSRKIVQLKL